MHGDRVTGVRVSGTGGPLVGFVSTTVSGWLVGNFIILLCKYIIDYIIYDVRSAMLLQTPNLLDSYVSILALIAYVNNVTGVRKTK